MPDLTRSPGQNPVFEDSPDLCQPFIDALPITGVSLTVIASSGNQAVLCSSDSVAARIDELQFDLGEGPQWAATRSGKAVLVPDLAADVHGAWPIFGAAVRELAVGAIFCIPVRMGAVSVGAATLYRRTPGELSEDNQAAAVAIASAAATSAVNSAMQSATADDEAESTSAPRLRREVHQATGMILVQLDTTATIAYSRMQAYAFATDRTVQSVAHSVVARELRFDDLPQSNDQCRRRPDDK